MPEGDEQAALTGEEQENDVEASVTDRADDEEAIPMEDLPSDAVDPDYDPDEEAETDYDLGEKAPMSHGVKVRGKVKRGEGTRDQDELVIEGRGECAAEAVIDFEDALSAAEERGWADRLRRMQPDGEEDQDDDE